MKRLLPPAVVFAIVASVYLAGGLEPVEHRLTDGRFRLTERAAGSDLVLVTVDPRSLETLDVWPWPRGYHATVLENLLDAGARRVAFDIDFGSRSIAEEDDQFERALASAGGRVVLPIFQQWEQDPSGMYRLDDTGPLPAFRRHVTLASINVVPEPGGLTRRYLSSGEFDGEEVPSLAVALGAGFPPVGESFQIDFGIVADSIPRISYLDVLTGTFDRAAVRGNVVLIGSTAVELGDQIAVPRYAALPGPVVQALAYESLFQGRALRRVSPWAALVAALAIALLLGPWVAKAPWRAGLVAVAGCIAVAFIVSIALQHWKPLILDISPSVVSAVGLYAVALVQRLDQQTLRLLAQGLRIRRTERAMRHVVEHSFDAILTVLDDGTVETANRAATRIFRRSEQDCVGRPIGELLPDDAASGAERTNPYEAVAVRSDGVGVPVEVAATTMATEDARRRVLFVRDITDRKTQQRKLEHQAMHDALTGLPNRYSLAPRIDAALAAAREDRRPIAFMILDLDRFKEINDTLGHQTGDVMLEEIARRLPPMLRPGDTIARLGGDEFAVLLPATDVRTARSMADRLLGCLARPFNVGGLSLRVGSSIGIAMYPEHGRDAEQLTRHADVAMYVAKRTRTGVEAYDAEKDFSSVRQLTLTGELGDAIREEHLLLHYQPKVSAATGRIVGVEALVRWQHPQHGIIPPDEFIALAEHSGLIRPLTNWVLQTSIRQCAEWRRQGLDLGLAVNLSARNLLEEELPGTLEQMLETARLPATAMTLEVTESVIMEDPKRALEVVTELDRLGLRISIDDFGTGYSSLGYLRRLPASEIKIDKSFILEMDRNPSDTMIVRSTIELAHNLGLEVVVEGVESEMVWIALRSFGCDYGQGYYFGRPMPAEELGSGLTSQLLSDGAADRRRA